MSKACDESDSAAAAPDRRTVGIGRVVCVGITPVVVPNDGPMTTKPCSSARDSNQGISGTPLYLLRCVIFDPCTGALRIAGRRRSWNRTASRTRRRRGRQSTQRRALKQPDDEGGGLFSAIRVGPDEGGAANRHSGEH